MYLAEVLKGCGNSQEADERIKLLEELGFRGVKKNMD